jgi:tetratricopeptide (TPR) repeat protein
VLLALLFAAAAFPAVRRALADLLGQAEGETLELAQRQPGGTLVLISQFANYSGAQVGYNIAGRLQEALEQEFQSAGLAEVQLAAAAETAEDEQAARELGARWGASLVVWGEYDSGRVIAHVSAPEAASGLPGVQHRWLVVSPEQLSATINTDLPQEVRWMALYVLGRVHFLAGRLDQAEAALTQAQAAPPSDPSALAAVDYYLGVVESQKPQADLNEVIAYYSEALALQPAQTAALNNRGVAYLERGSSGDLERAEADLRRALFYHPDDAVPLFNLALTLARQGQPHLPDALELLERAEQADPDSAGVQNALCWFLGLSGSPQQALPHCDRAVDLDDSGNSNDSRGLTLALLGRPQEAAAEFEAFLARLEVNDPLAYAQYAPSRREWVEALERGENPFDEATLVQLLQE